MSSSSFFHTILITGSMLIAAAGANAQNVPRPAEWPVAAEINGVSITLAEIDAAAGPALRKLQTQIDGLRRRRLDNIITKELVKTEAMKRGLTSEQLWQLEVTDKV